MTDCARSPRRFCDLMIITAELFEAFFHCRTKCYLRSLGEVGSGNAYADWIQTQNESCQREGRNRLMAATATGECIVGWPITTDLKTAKWRIAFRCVLRSHEVESSLHALERVPSKGRGQPTQFVPVRFARTSKVTRLDRLLVAFDGFVLSKLIGREICFGKLMYNDSRSSLTVKTSALANEVKMLSEEISATLSRHSPPELILNHHCIECEYRTRCRQAATEKEELSLLPSMTEKERAKLHRKGIFSITQLSYTFRPRRRSKRLFDKRPKYSHALKALAIREGKIYIVETPELSIQNTPVYLDVEGLPDRDFYYLIGVRFKTAQGFVQHSLWADDADAEKKIWTDFLQILSGIPDPVLIHYGHYESTFLSRMRERYGGPPKSSASAKAINAAVNLVSIIFARVYFPTYSNGLKDIASTLGARWRVPDASGLQAIVQRYRWEHEHLPALKDQLIAYNEDDCTALSVLADHLTTLVHESKTRTDVDFADAPKQTATECGAELHRAFEGLLRSAHWNYSQKKLRFRDAQTGTRVRSRQIGRRISRKGKLSKAKGRLVSVPRKRKCPEHPAQALRPSKRVATRSLLDLVLTKSGFRKVVVRYVGRRAYCPLCHKAYLPPALERSRNQIYGRGLQAWAAYQRVALRLSYRLIAKATQDFFHERIEPGVIETLVNQCSDRYAPAEALLLRQLLQSPVIHVDETKMSILGVHQFVWVITDGSRVIFRLTETRETDFLKQLLAGFSGTLVSDFYCGYDSLPWRQQKCLVHLIRDLNDDLWKNPFDVEYEQFVSAVRDLLGPMLEDVQRFGLKAIHLRKHQKQVERFYKQRIGEGSGYHELTAKYQKRFERYRNSLFCFLDDDGIPWNNNAAERALRHLAVQRKISGAFSEQGARRYLRMLAIAQTCRFQNKSFLNFLWSGRADVDKYEDGPMEGRGPQWPRSV